MSDFRNLSSKSFLVAQKYDMIFTALTWFLGFLGLLLPIFIITFVVFNGIQYISIEFLTSGPAGFPLGTSGGILPAIQGSLALIGIGLALALPLGVGGAIYLSEYATSKHLINTFRFCVECLAGIPAIVYGLFGYSFLVIFLTLNISLLAGGITMGLVMFPIILIGSQEAMESVEEEFRESSMSLGVTKSYTILRIILIKAIPGIVSVTTLAAGHAFGSAAPLLYTCSVIFAKTGLNLGNPVMTLPTHLYYLVSEGTSFGHAYGTAFVLICVLLTTNLLAMALSTYIRK